MASREPYCGKAEKNSNPIYSAGMIVLTVRFRFAGVVFLRRHRLFLLNPHHSRDDGALGRAMALKRECDLAAHDRLERGQRDGHSVLDDRDAAVGLRKGKRLCAPNRHLDRPAAAVSRLPLPKARVHGRLAIADGVGAKRLFA
jgi:hypothetical protein